MGAYGVLLMLILFWAITQVPWEDKKPTVEDEAAMHEWFCRAPNQDSGPCVHFSLRKEHGPRADEMRKARLQTKAYAKQRSEMPTSPHFCWPDCAGSKGRRSRAISAGRPRG